MPNQPSAKRLIFGCLLMAGLIFTLPISPGWGQTAPSRPGAGASEAPIAPRRQNIVRLDIPVTLGRTVLGEVPAFVSSGDEMLGVDGATLVQLLGNYLAPEALDELRQRVSSDGRLTMDALRSARLGPTYDVGRVELRLDPPLERLALRSMSLGGYLPATGELAPPAGVSAYVNFLAGHDYVNDGGGKQPLVIDFDGAGNVSGNVLEGVGTYRDHGTRWARGDVRFVRDDEEGRIRYSAGDLSYNVDGFQTFQRTAGVSVARNFGLQPYRSSAPAGQSQINLERNARVDVLVNGQRMRTLDLAPGRYNVRDFPFVSGTNDVTLRITDEVGRTEIVRFPFVFDTTVLGAGEHDFGYTAGVVAMTTEAGRQYNDGDRVVSLYHAYGITDQLTLGVNYQGSRDVDVLGSEGRLATTIGTFRLDGAVSRFQTGTEVEPANSAVRGAAIRLQHRYADPPALGAANRSFASSLTYRDAAFTSLGSGPPSNPIFLDAAVLYGQRLVGDLQGSLGLGRQFGRYSQPDANTVDVNFSLPISEEITSSLMLSTRQQSHGGNDNRIYFSISWFPRASGHRFAVRRDTANVGRGLDWTYTPRERIDAVESNVSLDRTHDNDNLRGDVRYTGYRFTSSVSHSQNVGRVEGRGHSRRSTVNFGSALAFADGHFAVTRPISDSFILVAPHPSLSGQTIEVNRVGDTPDARSDMVSPPVLPDVNSYYYNHVVIDAPDLPLGYELGREVFNAKSGYRSGTVLPIGTGATVLGDGVLVDQTGKPLPLEGGTIASIDDPKRPRIEFFTGRTGRFRVEGLSPGRFRLELTNAPEAAIVFAIPAEAKGRFDLGRLTYRIEE